MIKLVVPGGETRGYPISHGDERFEPFPEVEGDPLSRWLVVVPDHAAAHFMHRGGFTLFKPTAEFHLSGVVVRVRNAAGAGCAARGVEYTPDANGVIIVPTEIVPDLEPHGYEVVPDDAADQGEVVIGARALREAAPQAVSPC